jgi:hypothetical protein
MAKKKNTSDIINNATPRDIPFCTANVWLPLYVPSATTSLNHNIIAYVTKIKPEKKIQAVDTKLCIVNTADVVNTNNAILVAKGQGEGETK